MNSNSRLYAISDLHLDHKENWHAFFDWPAFSNDWLILAGDICESDERFERALIFLQQQFAGVIWVPGNHELWVKLGQAFNDSVAKYHALVEICRKHAVLTPEDNFLRWDGVGGPHLIVPMFLLYDYSFRPDEVKQEDAVAWAMESGILCADERLIKPGQFGSLHAWCEARVRETETKMKSIDANLPLVMVNHFPLRYDLLRIKRIPRFSIWCGTDKTHNWHQDYSAAVVVSGHLHVRATDYRDGVRFEEVSLGYPRDWQRQRGMHSYLREILPGPADKLHSGGTIRWY